MYLTYPEYTSMGGSLPESSYALAEFKARKRIDYLTASRVQKMETAVPEEVKYAMLTLINLEGQYGTDVQITTAANTGDVSSFNTDGYSESYVTAGATAQTAAELEKTTTQEVIRLLYGVTDDTGTPLLYRGVRG